MRLKPKSLGDEFSLDEYNACQYLLYDMTCWNDEIILNTYTPYTGKYAKYLLQTSSYLNPEKNETLEIITTNKNATIQIKTSDTQIAFTKLNMSCTATLYIRQPVTQTGGDNTTQTISPSDYEDLPEYTEEELSPEPTLETKYTATTIDCTIKDNTITIPLAINGTLIAPINSLISRTIKIQYNFHAEPYIDIYNGKANQPNEILVDNVAELRKLIIHAPTDGTKTIFRLDSNINDAIYYISPTIIIYPGHNIEIRGGTNRKAILDGKYGNRSFIIRPGGHLTLKNLVLRNNSNTDDSIYESGKGGAILVEHSTTDEKFGLLEADCCRFENNTAYDGASIYSTFCGVYLNYCVFKNNTSTSAGAGVFYRAEDIILTFPNVYCNTGEIITPTVTVTDHTGKNVTGGTISFYITRNNTDTLIDTVNVTGGKASTTYTIPENATYTTLQITAVYTGTGETETEIAKNTVYIRKIEKYTAKMGNFTGTKGSTILLEATAYNEQNKQTTIPSASFQIEGIDELPVDASIEGTTYIRRWYIPETANKTYKVTFRVNDGECTPIQKTITVKDQVTTSTSNMTGLFVNMALDSNDKLSISESTVKTWAANGITDVYIRMIEYDSSHRRATYTQLQPLVTKYGMRCHVVMNVLYQSVSQLWNYPDTTRRVTWLTNEITKICNNLKFDGICFDYLRYTGTSTTGGKTNLTGKAGTTGHTKIQSLLKNLTTQIKNKKKDTIISMTVMPETSTNSTYYGQNYKEINEYVDYQMPMVFKGNYNAGDTWIVNVIKYIQTETSASNVVAIIQTYNTDTDTTKRTKTDMDTTIKQIKTINILGVALFRYGLIDSYPTSYKNIK